MYIGGPNLLSRHVDAAPNLTSFVTLMVVKVKEGITGSHIMKPYCLLIITALSQRTTNLCLYSGTALCFFSFGFKKNMGPAVFKRKKILKIFKVIALQDHSFDVERGEDRSRLELSRFPFKMTDV